MLNTKQHMFTRQLILQLSVKTNDDFNKGK